MGAGRKEGTVTDRKAILVQSLTAVAAGDRASLQTVYDMTSAKVFGTIIRIVRRREVAEDLVQEVYVTVWRRAGRFDPAKGSPITWLCTIARNLALNSLRKRGRDDEFGDDEFPDLADNSIVPADDWLCTQEDSVALADCLETLREDHRRSIKLAFFEGLSHSELAEKVDVPLGTLKSWIRRGLAGLRGCLGG